MNITVTIIIISLIGPFFGSFFGVCKKYNERQLRYMLSFAAGVMISVSVFELLPESYKKISPGLVLLGLLSGGLVMHFLNKLVPHYHHSRFGFERKIERFKRLAIFIFLGIFIHNLPEGIAVGIGALPGYDFSVLIALAIAIHDVPEAICVAAPLYYSTGSKLKSFLLTFLTVVPTVVGFLLIYYFLKNISGVVLGIIISATAGVMLYISLWELLPEVINKKKEKKKYLLSFLTGAALVFVLQVLFE